MFGRPISKIKNGNGSVTLLLMFVLLGVDWPLYSQIGPSSNAKLNIAVNSGQQKSDIRSNRDKSDPLKKRHFDVAVYGATPGGIAAAIAAARMGASVVLIEPTDHIGGVVSNGLTNSDIGKKQAVGGLFYEFTRRVLAYYRALDKSKGSGVVNAELSHNGYWFEASVAEKIYREMLAVKGHKITVYYRHQVTGAIKQDNRIRGLLLAQDLNEARREMLVEAKVFVDATYEGDLAALAGAPFRIGREARSEYGEPHAGRIYTRFGESVPLPGSTGEADAAIQAFCFRFHMTKDPANRVPVTKPVNFNRDDYHFLLEDFRAGKITSLTQPIQLYAMPNGKFEVNSNHPDEKTGVPSESLDVTEENWSWPTASPSERQKIYARYLSHNVGLIWLLQNDPEVPAAVRDEARQFGWCKDEWVRNNHLPRQVYVREGRRILGESVLTELDGQVDPNIKRTRIQRTSIGIVEYSFDSHGTHKYDPRFPGVREGYINIHHDPFQIPYGVLLPREVENLLVPVSCSASHVAYNALRMEPIFMALGQVSGTAASMAVKSGIAVRAIPVALLQREIVKQGGVITYLEDVPFDHKAFAAFQFLGARGMNLGYIAQPDKHLTRREAWDSLQRVLQVEGKVWTPPTERPNELLKRKDVMAWLREVGWVIPHDKKNDDAQMKAEDFAGLLYQAYAFEGIERK